MKLTPQNPQIRFVPPAYRGNNGLEIPSGETIVEFDIGGPMTVAEVGEPEGPDEIIFAAADDSRGTVCGHAVCDLDGFDIDGSVAGDLGLRDLSCQPLEGCEGVIRLCLLRRRRWFLRLRGGGCG